MPRLHDGDDLFGTHTADLVHLLISRVGLDETEVAAMDKQDALARLQRYWT
jgi:hypothetical protein